MSVRIQQIFGTTINLQASDCSRSFTMMNFYILHPFVDISVCNKKINRAWFDSI